MDYVMNRINLATTTADGKGAEPRGDHRDSLRWLNRT
jgi:hypothetical protein